MAFELLNHLYDNVTAKPQSLNDDDDDDDDYNDDDETTVMEDCKIMKWLDKIGFARFDAKNTNEIDQVLPTLSCLIRDYLGDGVWLCKLVSLCSGQIVKPAVSHVRSESAAVSNIRLAIQHLQQQSDMGNQRSLHPLDTVCELLHCGSLNTWRKLLTDLRDLYVVFERKAREFQSNHFPRFVTRMSLSNTSITSITHL